MASETRSQPARHQHDVRRFDGNVGAGADGKAHIRFGQGGRIVDPVADIGQRAQCLQTFHRSDLAVGQHLGHNFVDAKLAGDGVRRAAIVAGDHGNLQPQRVQCLDRLRRGFLDRVRNGDDCSKLAVDGGIER